MQQILKMLNVVNRGDTMQNVIWPIVPHTKAKHEILRRYLKAWFPIIAFSGSPRLVYVDGFAGPGEYNGGEEGSPAIAMRTLIEHRLRQKFSKKEFIFLFIDKEKERAKYLENLLEGKFPDCPPNILYDIIGAEFEPTLTSILDDLEEKGANLAPTFAFIDPFGFSGFTIPTLCRFFQYKKCEVLITFMDGFAKRFLDELREDTLDNLFASEKWRAARALSGRYRELCLLDLFVEQLKNLGNVKYVRTFGMSKGRRHIYDLVFATNGLDGLKVMKDAMWAVDPTGSYKFSDTTAGQTFLIDYLSYVPEIADCIYKTFRGKTAAVEEIKEFTIVETPYIFRKAPLKLLEENNKIDNVSGRSRRYTYPDRCRITFC